MCIKSAKASYVKYKSLYSAQSTKEYLDRESDVHAAILLQIMSAVYQMMPLANLLVVILLSASIGKEFVMLLAQLVCLSIVTSNYPQLQRLELRILFSALTVIRVNVIKKWLQ